MIHSNSGIVELRETDTLSQVLSKTEIFFRGFSLYYIRRGAAKLRWAGGGGGSAQHLAFCVKEPKKTGARSARRVEWPKPTFFNIRKHDSPSFD